MANTFSQIYLQFVFAVKHRQSLIRKENKEELHKYITGLVQNRGAKMHATMLRRSNGRRVPNYWNGSESANSGIAPQHRFPQYPGSILCADNSRFI